MSYVRKKKSIKPDEKGTVDINHKSKNWTRGVNVDTVRRAEKSQDICFNYSKGTCNRGDTCKFVHSEDHNKNSIKYVDKNKNLLAPRNDVKFSSNSVSSDVIKYFENLVSAVQSSSNENNRSLSSILSLNDVNKKDLWNMCWNLASSGKLSNDLGRMISLPKALLKLPNKVEYMPMIDFTVNLLSNILNAYSTLISNYNNKENRLKNASKSVSNLGIKMTLEIIIEVVRDRLTEGSKTYNLIIDAKAASKSVSNLADSFQKQVIATLNIFPEDAVYLGSLLSRMNEFIVLKNNIERISTTYFNEKSIVSFERTLKESCEKLNEIPWNGWKLNPTVGWLMSDSWHKAPELRNRYESPDEYADCLLRIWTLLTFYWGSGAVWPRCSHRNQGGNNNNKNNNTDVMVCGEPLLAAVANFSIQCCARFKGGASCNNRAVWKCHRYDHDALCIECLRQKQRSLVGEPSMYASTDIYDAFVSKEEQRREGYIHNLTHLTSRKPPKIAPNWNTTYRLKSSCLVAVVPLGAAGEALTTAHRIQWAEVVTYDTRDFFNESNRRNRGQISVRLLTRGDCSSFSADVETPLSIGTRVALIDLRVFVPEVVSVLATFANDSFKLHLSKIPFIRRLIGIEPSPNIEDILPFSTNTNDNSMIALFVKVAIEKSEVECIRMLPPQLKASIVEQIVNLKPIQSLYGTQLQAFGAALCCSMHCTHGPPGTGKRTLKTAGYPTGPILMLSYKNHALDEFLVDVVRLSHPPLHANDLIRSGKIENFALKNFAERNSEDEKSCVQELNDAIRVQKKARHISKQWRDVADHFEAKIEIQQSRFNDSNGYLSAVAICVYVLTVLKTVDNTNSTGILENKSSSGGIMLNAEQCFQLLSAVSDSVIEEALTYDKTFLPTLFDYCKVVNKNWIEETLHWELIQINEKQDLFVQSIELLEVWIVEWLNGQKPSHRCTANDNRTNQKIPAGHQKENNNIIKKLSGHKCLALAMATNGMLYCNRHNCCSFYDTSCCFQRVNGTQFCNQHMCQYTKDFCIFEHLPVSKYCADHCCPDCVDIALKVEKQHLIVEPSINVNCKENEFACKIHQCNFKSIVNGAECGRLNLLPYSYCFGHCCEECLRISAVNKNSQQQLQLQCYPVINQYKFCVEHKCTVRECTSLKECGSFCSRHKCHFKNCFDSVDSPYNEQSIYCSNHTCNHPLNKCHNIRFNIDATDESYFCLLHTCKICLKLNEPLRSPVLKESPWNSCELHPLCQHTLANGKLCSNQVVQSSSYCEEHKEQVVLFSPNFNNNNVATKTMSILKEMKAHDDKCCGISTKSKRCQSAPLKNNSTIGNKFLYCQAHLMQKKLHDPILFSLQGSLTTNNNDIKMTTNAVEQNNSSKIEINNNLKAGVSNSFGKVDAKDMSQPGQIERSNNEDSSDDNENDDDDEDDGDKQIPFKIEQNGGVLTNNASSTNNNAFISENKYLHSFTQKCPGINFVRNTPCEVLVVRNTDFASIENENGLFYCAAHSNVWNSNKYRKLKNTNASVAVVDTLKPESSSVSIKSDDKLLSLKSEKQKEKKFNTNESVKNFTKKDVVHNAKQNSFLEFENEFTGGVVDEAFYGMDPDEMEMIVNDMDFLSNQHHDPFNSLKQKSDTNKTKNKLKIDANKNDYKDNNKTFTDNNNIQNNNDENNHEEDVEIDDAMNDDVERLKEIFDEDDDGNDNNDDDDSDDETNESNYEIDESNIPIVLETALQQVNSWSWSMSQKDRVASAVQLLRAMSKLVDAMRSKTESFVVEARRRRAEAGAAVFKSAKIVGATVVGASKRLEAIRAAEPFAVVVEEACEVMEPTLISVLAVSSLKKLELVGDHRQLPAFVQQCWYNLESSLPSIKTSLFERLIMGEIVRFENRKKKNVVMDQKAETVPCTILDEQRRMRACISDITRPDYEDIVDITDHPQTEKQLVGDGYLKTKKGNSSITAKKIQEFRKLWCDGGRSIPGVQSPVYFWDLPNNEESRPTAGLSACNMSEAIAVASLTKWLLHCGVPTTSISIITPYKGQKNTIIKELRKQKCIPGYTNKVNNNNDSGDEIIVSTVDRYQGDENDIVILSLVRARPGNRFVALQNRFIVAVSRARLGFFIIGSVNAVTKSNNSAPGPAHWIRFIESLKSPIEESSEYFNDFQHDRVGKTFPICCPFHKDSKKNLTLSSEFVTPESWHTLCSKPCTFELSCGHHCGLACHSPTISSHNTKCCDMLKRPCATHEDLQLYCYEIQKRSGESARSAIARFECMESVTYKRLSCEHSVDVHCYQLKNIENSLENCKVVVSDFYQPECNHVIKSPKCYQKMKYMLEAPKCMKKVDRQRPCDCWVVGLECHTARYEMKHHVQCEITRNVQRPRCNHILSLKCCEYTNLVDLWQQNSGGLAWRGNVVEHGEEYGRSEYDLKRSIPFCLVPVKYRGPCGHVFDNVPCNEAFLHANKKLLKTMICNKLVEINCGFCSTIIKTNCWAVSSFLKDWNPFHIDHETKKNISISEEMLSRLMMQSPSIEIVRLMNNMCSNHVTISRDCSADHHIDIPCNDMLQIILKKRKIPNCRKQVSHKLPSCGHTIKIACHEKHDTMLQFVCPKKVEYRFVGCRHTIQGVNCADYLDWTYDDLHAPKCVKTIEFNHPICRHDYLTQCWVSSKYNSQEWTPWTKDLEKPTYSTYFSHYDESNDPVFKEIVSFDDVKPRVAPHEFELIMNHKGNGLLRCKKLVSYKRSCDHVIDVCCTDVYCADFDKVIGKCQEPVEIDCTEENCLHTRSVPCHLLRSGAAVDQCRNIVQKVCNVCNVTMASTECCKKYVQCNEQIIFTLNCGHDVSWLCGVDNDPRQNPTFLCRECILPMWDGTLERYNFTKNEQYQNFETFMRQLVIDSVLKIGEIVNSVELDKNKIDFKRHFEGRKKVLHAIRDRIMDCHDFSMPPPFEFATREDMQQQYKIVFVPIRSTTDIVINNNINYNNNNNNNNNNKKNNNNNNKGNNNNKVKAIQCNLNVAKNAFTASHETGYGNGMQLMELCKQNMEILSSTNKTTASFHFCVGIAFTYYPLQNKAPFYNYQNNKSRKQSNKHLKNLFELGHDCVEMVHPPTNNNVTTKKTLLEYVYWTPGTAIPLFNMEIKFKSFCVICQDFFMHHEGVHCSNFHFLCFDHETIGSVDGSGGGCLMEYINAAKKPDAMNFVDNNDNLLCPECKDVLKIDDIIANNKELLPAFNSYMSLKLQINAEKVAKQRVEEEKIKFQKELERISKLVGEDKEVAMLKLQIVDEILTLQCPRKDCKAAFTDFTGCFALTCSRNGCRAGFCAWCLSDCGGDAHGHVARCVESKVPGGLFATKEMFDAHHQVRRGSKIKELLRKESVSVRNKVLKEIEQELRDLKIIVTF